MKRIVLAVALLGLASSASADAVGPDPTDCPTGTRGTSCHGLEYCALRRCSGAGDCDSGEICQSRDLCIRQATCGGRRVPDSAPPPPVDVVEGMCSDMCDMGTCESRMVCVPDGTPPGTGGAGCGCRAAGPGPSVPAVLLVLGIGLAWLWRRG